MVRVERDSHVRIDRRTPAAPATPKPNSRLSIQTVLGVGIAGSGAGELIGEATLAIEMGATAGDLKLTIHAHPTLSETLMESAEVFFGQSTHVYKPKRAKAVRPEARSPKPYLNSNANEIAAVRGAPKCVPLNGFPKLKA
jgi:hypothetical protein